MTSIHHAILLIAFTIAVFNVEGFQQMHAGSTAQRMSVTSLSFFGNKKKYEEFSEEEPQTNRFLGELQGMMRNFDAIVDDFVYKRMGNGEQYYGKRKYNPSGNIEGDYNGMGQSDLIRIEIARAQKEEMELRRKRRLEAEEEARETGDGPK